MITLKRWRSLLGRKSCLKILGIPTTPIRRTTRTLLLRFDYHMSRWFTWFMKSHTRGVCDHDRPANIHVAQ